MWQSAQTLKQSLLQQIQLFERSIEVNGAVTSLTKWSGCDRNLMLIWFDERTCELLSALVDLSWRDSRTTRRRTRAPVSGICNQVSSTCNQVSGTCKQVPTQYSSLPILMWRHMQAVSAMNLYNTVTCSGGGWGWQSRCVLTGASCSRRRRRDRGRVDVRPASWWQSHAPPASTDGAYHM